MPGFCHAAEKTAHDEVHISSPLLAVSAQIILVSVCFAVQNGHTPIVWISSSVWLTSTLYWCFFPSLHVMRYVDMATVAFGATALVAFSTHPLFGNWMRVLGMPTLSEEWMCMTALVPYSVLVSLWFYTKGCESTTPTTADMWHACIHVFATLVNCLVVTAYSVK